MPRKSTRTTITKEEQTLSEISVTGNQRVPNFWFYLANKNQFMFEVFHGCNVPKNSQDCNFNNYGNRGM